VLFLSYLTVKGLKRARGSMNVVPGKKTRVVLMSHSSTTCRDSAVLSVQLRSTQLSPLKKVGQNRVSRYPDASYGKNITGNGNSQETNLRKRRSEKNRGAASLGTECWDCHRRQEAPKCVGLFTLSTRNRSPLENRQRNCPMAPPKTWVAPPKNRSRSLSMTLWGAGRKKVQENVPGPKVRGGPEGNREALHFP